MAHSLYGLVQIQHLIASYEKDSNDIMHMIAECARQVANATGIGIAPLEGGQLICRARVGTAPTSIPNLPSVLTPCDNRNPRTAILRVENAETDSRIDADISRQLGANALLMLPIYQAHTLSGVLAVLFSEPHIFLDREVRTYQLMARLLAESMSPQVEQKNESKTATQATVPQAILRMTSEMREGPRPQFLREPERKTQTAGTCEAPQASLRNRSNWSLLRAATSMRQVLRSSSVNKLYGRLPTVPIVILLIAVCGWIAYHHNPLPGSHSAMPGESPAEAQVPKSLTTKKQPKVHTGTGHDSSKSAFKRKRVGENEVDYVADDVTIRQFGPASPLKEHRTRNKPVGTMQKSERDGALARPLEKSR